MFMIQYAYYHKDIGVPKQILYDDPPNNISNNADTINTTTPEDYLSSNQSNTPFTNT